MEVGEMIAKMQKHFMDKLLSKQFQVIEIGTHVMKITIDEFPFSIWTANGEKFCNFFQGIENYNTINMPLLTEIQQKIVWTYIEDLLESNKKLTKEKQIADLEAKLLELKSSL